MVGLLDRKLVSSLVDFDPLEQEQGCLVMVGPIILIKQFLLVTLQITYWVWKSIVISSLFVYYDIQIQDLM